MAATKKNSQKSKPNTAAKKKSTRVGRVVPLTGCKKRRDTGALAKAQIEVKKGRKVKTEEEIVEGLEVVRQFKKEVMLANKVTYSSAITWRNYRQVLLNLGVPEKNCSESTVNDAFKRSKGKLRPPSRLLIASMKAGLALEKIERLGKFSYRPVNTAPNKPPKLIMVVPTVNVPKKTVQASLKAFGAVRRQQPKSQPPVDQNGLHHLATQYLKERAKGGPVIVEDFLAEEIGLLQCDPLTALSCEYLQRFPVVWDIY